MAQSLSPSESQSTRLILMEITSWQSFQQDPCVGVIGGWEMDVIPNVNFVMSGNNEN